MQTVVRCNLIDAIMKYLQTNTENSLRYLLLLTLQLSIADQQTWLSWISKLRRFLGRSQNFVNEGQNGVWGWSPPAGSRGKAPPLLSETRELEGRSVARIAHQP